MKTYLTLKNGVFVWTGGFATKDTAKSAGMWWHGGNCRPNCGACKAGVGKAWWTFKPEVASKLEKYADEAARAALGAHKEAVRSSAAADAEVDVPVPEGLTLMPFQRAGLAYAVTRKNVLFGDEMGLGKTIQALSLINADPSVRRVLVVCPASLRLNWAREAERWLVRPMRAQVLLKSGSLDPEAELVVVSYPLLKGVLLEALLALEWDLLIADEAHALKNKRGAKRAQAVLGSWDKAKKVANPGLVDRAWRVAFLTGTPIPNGRPIEAYPLLAALDPSFRNFKVFTARYCAPTHNGYAWDYTGAANLGELQERMRATVMVRRLKADVLKELPVKRRQLITLAPNGAAKLIERERDLAAGNLDALEEARLAVELAEETGDADGYRAAVKALRGVQGVLFEQIARIRKEIAVAKLPHVVEHVEGLLEEVGKVIVFAHHHEVVDGLMDAFKSVGAVKLDGRMSSVEKQESVDAFQSDPNARVFVASITAAGVGITLTAAANVVFAEGSWVPGDLTQAEDRAHRIGQEESVLIQHLVFDGSLDAEMVARAVAKQERIDAALDLEPVHAVPEVDEGKVKAERERVEKRAKRDAADPVTEERRAATHLALRILAGRCDGARKIDGAGFNKVDAYIGHKLARRGRLSDGEVRFAARVILPKYHRQLGEDLLAAVRGGAR